MKKIMYVVGLLIFLLGPIKVSYAAANCSITNGKVIGDSGSTTLDPYDPSFVNPQCFGAGLDAYGVAYQGDVDRAIDSAINSTIKGLSQGISVSAAIASIPKLDRDKIFSIGLGFGGMEGQSAAAVGAAARVTDNFVINGNVGHGLGSTYRNINTTVWGAGGALSW